MTTGPGITQVARFIMLLAFAATFSFSVGAQELTHQYLHSLCGNNCEVNHEHDAHSEAESQVAADALTCDFYLFLIGPSRDLLVEPVKLTFDLLAIENEAKVSDAQRAPRAFFLTSVSARGPPSRVLAI